MSEYLVCRICGSQECDKYTVDYMKKKFRSSGLPTNKIPYYCENCMMHADTDEDYLMFEKDMKGTDEVLICQYCRKVVSDGRVINSVRRLFPRFSPLEDLSYTCPSCEKIHGPNIYFENARKQMKTNRRYK